MAARCGARSWSASSGMARHSPLTAVGRRGPLPTGRGEPTQPLARRVVRRPPSPQGYEGSVPRWDRMADDTSEALLSSPSAQRKPAEPCAIPVGVGRRVLVVGNLRLGREATASSTWAVACLARALETWSGAGVVVLAGNLFDRPCGDTTNSAADAAAALAAHPELVDALAAYSGRDDRRVVCLPG